jgi:hypothetical protein
MGPILYTAIAVAFFAAGGSEARREPTYRGRTAAEWAPLLSDRHDGTRLEAISAVLAIGRDTDINPLLPEVTPLLSDGTPLIRMRAARWFALVRKDRRVVDIALRALSDDAGEYVVWTEAVQALATMGPGAKYAVPRLRTLAEQEEQFEKDHGPPAGARGEFLRVLRRAIDAIEPPEGGEPRKPGE